MEIKQIIQTSGKWSAYYQENEGRKYSRPVACWALFEERRQTASGYEPELLGGCVIGLIASGVDGLMSAEDRPGSDTFIFYAPTGSGDV